MDVNKIYSAISQLLNDELMMIKYSKNAYHLAINSFDKSIVSQNFYDAIVGQHFINLI